MSAVTIVLAYSSDGLRKLDVPAQTVDPGEQVRIYLWARSREDLTGYRLAQGADTLGTGTLRQYPGQIEEQYFELAGDDVLQAFDWPVTSLASVVAYGNLYADIDGAVSLVALPGEDVTRLFKLAGNALARNVEAEAPTLYGTVRARADRSPWCLEWRWTVPGVLAVSGGDDYDFGRTPRLYFDASVIKAGNGQVLTSLADRLGNLIRLSGSMRVWFVKGDCWQYDYEPYIYNGEYDVRPTYSGGRITTWYGELPYTASLIYRGDSFYCKDEKGRPCIRLSTVAIKKNEFGLMFNGYNPHMSCISPYGTVLKRTVFIVVAGCKSYAVGREQLSIVLGGYSGDHDNDGMNLGATALGECTTKMTIRAMGGAYLDNNTGRQFIHELYWFGFMRENSNSCRYIGSEVYHDASPTLITLEIDATSNSYRVSKNGVFKEQFFESYAVEKWPFFPVSVLRFDANVTYYNDTYDTLGVRYQTHQDVYEALLFDGLFETAKRQDIEAYLMRKWGIAA